MDPATTRPSTEETDAFEIRKMMSLVRNRWKLIALCLVGSVAGGLGLGLGYLRVAPVLHEATVVVEVPRQAPVAVHLDSATEDDDFSGGETLKTIEQNLQRISLFQGVMERPEVRDNPALARWLEEPVSSYAPGELAQLLGEWTRVRLRRGTRLISISVEHQDPAFAEVLAGAVVDEFVAEWMEMRSGSSDETLEFLLGEVERAKAKLQESEEELGKLKEFEDALALKKKIEEQEDLILGLTQRYRDKHPTLIQARTGLTALRKRLRAELLPAYRYMGGEKEDEVFMINDAGLEIGAPRPMGRDAQLEAALQMLETRFNVLSLEVESDAALYETLVARVSEAKVTKEWDASPFHVVEPAYAPLDSAKPKGIRVMGVSVVLCGGVGMGLLWMLIVTDSSFRTVPEAEEATGIPVLGAIPGSGKGGLLSRERDGGCPGLEAVRLLRASLSANGRGDSRRTVLVSSALPGEGKTFIAANLAAAFAREEKGKTLLIDGNLRRPALEKFFGVKPGSTGLAAALSGECDAINCVRDSGIEGLDLMLIEEGGSPEIPSADALAGLFEDLSGRYDRIVIDSSQVNNVSDPLLIAPHVDAAILVARAARTPRDTVLRARDLLDVVGSRPAGLVLNGLAGS